MPTQVKKDIIFSLLFLCIGFYISIESFSYGFKSSLFLRGLALSLTAMSAFYLISKLVKHAKSPIAKEQIKTQKTAISAISIFILVGCCAALLPIFGFLASFAIFIYASQVCIAKKHKNFYLFYAIVLSLFIYLIFFKFLGVPHPESLLSLEPYIPFL